jgi:hypothetical protein
MGENSIVSILILLVLFIGLPALLRRLGQYTAASKPPLREEERPKDSVHPDPIREYLEEPPMRDDYVQPGKDSFTNKPITPKWF